MQQRKKSKRLRWRKSQLFEEREQAALEYVEAMTYLDCGVDEKIFRRLKRHFDDDAIIKLTGLIAFQNLSSKIQRGPRCGRTGVLP